MKHVGTGVSGPPNRRGSQEVAMSRYAAVLVVPLIIGILIAVTVPSSTGCANGTMEDTGVTRRKPS